MVQCKESHPKSPDDLQLDWRHDLDAGIWATRLDGVDAIGRNRIAGADVTACLDFALQLIAESRDANYPQNVELLREYEPHFRTGEMHARHRTHS